MDRLRRLGAEWPRRFSPSTLGFEGAEDLGNPNRPVSIQNLFGVRPSYHKLSGKPDLIHAVWILVTDEVLILVVVTIFCLILTSDGHYSRIIFRRYETILVSIFFNQTSGVSKFFPSEQASEGLDLAVWDLTKTIPADFNKLFQSWASKPTDRWHCQVYF